MRTFRTTRIDECLSLAGDWDILGKGVPFRSRHWLGTWWRHYEPAMSAAGRSVELYAVCVMDDDKLIGLAPWYVDRSRAAGNIVRFLGSGEVCSDYLSVLCRAEHQTTVASALSTWLTDAATAPGRDNDRWDVLEWDNVAADDTVLAELGAQLEQSGAGIHARSVENTWRIELPDSLDAYLGQLSKSHRKQLRQLQRRFIDTGRAVLRTVESQRDLEHGWKVLVDLHQRRLESLGKPGCFRSETFARFHRDVTDALYQAGSLRLHWLELDGRPVAAEYQLADASTMFAYQGGIEPAALEVEPGRLITLVTLALAIENGFQAFDFCRGDEPYKAHFRANPRQNVTWRIVSNRPVARLRHGLWVAGQSARKWVKSGMQFAAGKPL